MTITVTVRKGGNKKQDICIEYLTNRLRGEVAGGHAGGGGTDTIEFLLEKERGFRITTSAVTAELFVASNLSVFLQRNTTKMRRN